MLPKNSKVQPYSSMAEFSRDESDALQIQQFQEAIAELRDAGFSLYQISCEIDRPVNFITNALKSGSKPAGSVIAGLAVKFFVNPDRLLFGRGPMILDRAKLKKKERWKQGVTRSQAE